MKARECLFRETMEQDTAELWDGRLWQSKDWEAGGRGAVTAEEASQERRESTKCAGKHGATESHLTFILGILL